jgi:hypothetical protein
VGRDAEFVVANPFGIKRQVIAVVERAVGVALNAAEAYAPWVEITGAGRALPTAAV